MGTSITIKNLTKRFGNVNAVNNVSLTIEPGSFLTLLGPSGCGKTTTGRTILRLVPPTSGQVTFEGKDFFKLGGGELKQARRNMQIIFQDPFGSLDPRLPVGANGPN